MLKRAIINTAGHCNKMIKQEQRWVSNKEGIINEPVRVCRVSTISHDTHTRTHAHTTTLYIADVRVYAQLVSITVSQSAN